MDDVKMLSFIEIIPELKKYLVDDMIRIIYEYFVLVHKIKYIYEESFGWNDANSPHIYVKWIGEYTIGYCNFRGTKLWFKPNAAKSIGACNEEIFYKSLEEESPINECNLLSDSLEFLLNNLESKIEKPGEFKYLPSRESLIQEIDYDDEMYYIVEKYYDDIKETDDIFIDIYPTNKVWIIHKKNEIIKELKEVLKECNNKNVKWHWI